MNNIVEIMDTQFSFQNTRNWQQFHDSRNLAMWKDLTASEEILIIEIKEELAGFYTFANLLAVRKSVEFKEIVFAKIVKSIINIQWIKQMETQSYKIIYI